MVTVTFYLWLQYKHEPYNSDQNKSWIQLNNLNPSELLHLLFMPALAPSFPQFALHLCIILLH